MCLDTTKQGYVLLAAFNEAAEAGLNFNGLVDRMGEISEREFGSRAYVFGPQPLLPVLEELVGSKDLKSDGQGKFFITPGGSAHFRSLKAHEVDPLLASG